MKQLFFLTMIMLSAIFMQCSSQPPKSPRITVEGKDIKVVYGQPSKKDRVIFGELVPYGQVWRTGANEATEITFAKNATFAGKQIPAGTYSFFTVPTETEWTVILNSELKQWGSYGYDKAKGKNVLEAQVPSKKTDTVVEKLTYRFDANNNLIIEWDRTQVEVPVSF